MTESVSQFDHRSATKDDIETIVALMQASIAGLMPEFLSAQEVQLARSSMGLDQSLISDGTYFIIEADGQAGRLWRVGQAENVIRW